MHTVGELKDLTLLITLNTGCVSGTWMDPIYCKMGTFFLRSLALSLVCQFIEISNQMEVNGHVSNFEKIFFI